MTVVIAHGDARALPLPDESVDLIVTSPPYHGLRSYTDSGEHYAAQIGAESTPGEFISALIDCTYEMKRVLRPSGSIFVNLGDKYQSTAPGTFNSPRDIVGGRGSTAARARGVYRPDLGVPKKSLYGFPWRYAIRCIDELGLTLRAEMVWSKWLPETLTDRVRRAHETWFHFTLGQRYFVDREELKGLPGSIWRDIAPQRVKIPVKLGVEHFATFPVEWPRRLIAAWCPPEGIVLDPFGGTGTTALAATMSGRTGISLDASADYGRVAQWRCADVKERARAAQTAAAVDVVAPMHPTAVNQESLLDLLGDAS